MTAQGAELGHMVRAIELAARGEGRVEPNPMVGCVIVADDGRVVGEGWHTAFGAPHAEIEALQAAGGAARGATMYVSLEPCCHHGKTPPCVEAVIAAGVRRVVAAQVDPNPQVAHAGIAALRQAGIDAQVGLMEELARRLNAPYLKLMETHRPWVIAKWAMTLDGKLAASTGQSKWISGPESRAVAHRLRGRVDAIVVGRGTVEADDPLLTARPPGPRLATRIVLDSGASLSPESQLVRTAAEAPVLVAAAAAADQDRVRRLVERGCEVLLLPGDSAAERLAQLLDELGRRRMTNVMIEGGSKVLGSLLDARAIDEVQVFIAPRLLGGAAALSPFSGAGIAVMAGFPVLAASLALDDMAIERLGDDLAIRGRVRR